MSLAPASSRGAFLKARLAVNGIQCAARSFGTLTVLALGLLSSMRASFDFVGGRGRLALKLSASPCDGNVNNLRYSRYFGRILASAAPFQLARARIESAVSNPDPQQQAKT